MAGMKLRFTIRDLFWMLALVAVSVGWWLDHAKTQQNAQKVTELVNALYSGNGTPEEYARTRDKLVTEGRLKDGRWVKK